MQVATLICRSYASLDSSQGIDILAYVATNVIPKSQDQVHKHRRTKSKEGKVDEVKPNRTRRNAKPLTQVRTNSKQLLFPKEAQAFHADSN